MGKTLFLVDGTSQLFRAYFALPGLTNRDGLPTNAVYGFTTMLRKLIKDEAPGHLAVAFDVKGPTFRHEKYASYKANRPPAPEDLNVQVPYAKNVCEAFGIPVLELPGYEADDLIATYTRLAREAGFDVVVVASDKDLMQLVGDGVVLLNPVKNVTLDDAGVEETFGVPPVRVRDVQGLMGDSVDNIPGVPGVGGKTALAMVRTYGPVEAVVARAQRFVALFDAREELLAALSGAEKEKPLTAASAENVSTALGLVGTALRDLRDNESDAAFRDRLEQVDALIAAAPAAGLSDAAGKPGRAVFKEWKELKGAIKGLEKGSARRMWYAVAENEPQAFLSRDLATLHEEVPVTFHAEGLETGSPDRARLRSLFESLNFRALVKELDTESADEGESPPHIEPSSTPADYRIARTREEIAALATACGEQGRVAIRVMANRADPLRASLAGVAFATPAGGAVYVPIRSDDLVDAPQLDLGTVRATLGPVLADRKMVKTARDLKSQFHVLRRHGIETDGWGLDVMVAAFLLDPGHTEYDTPSLADRYLGRSCGSFDELAGSGAKQLTLDQIDDERVGTYAAEAAEIALRLSDELAARLDAEGLRELYETVDGPLLPVLSRMEEWGIGVDRSVLEAMSGEMETELARTRKQIVELAGVDFNVDSPKQMREVLFDRLGLKPGRKTAKSKVSSTDAQTLEELADSHPIAGKILSYRELAKLKGTYVDALPQLVDSESGRVHTRYNPTGAATGRLSSSDPNLQNIPARTEAGLRIRSAFVPAAGFVFLASDYSQVELRILAHLTGDPELIEAFGKGEDIHRHTASLVFGVDADLVTDAMRRRAKAVNFGVIYGMSATRLAREQGISRIEAGQFIQTYFERFSKVRGYIDHVREEATQDAAVRTLFGRVRHFPQLRQRVARPLREQALRAAVNTTVQGTAADLMKMAMLDVDRFLTRTGSGARTLLQVHDELLLEVPEGEVDSVSEGVRRAMEEVHRLEVPLVVDQKVGRSWMEVT